MCSHVAGDAGRVPLVHLPGRSLEVAFRVGELLHLLRSTLGRKADDVSEQLTEQTVVGGPLLSFRLGLVKSLLLLIHLVNHDAERAHSQRNAARRGFDSLKPLPEAGFKVGERGRGEVLRGDERYRSLKLIRVGRAGVEMS